MLEKPFTIALEGIDNCGKTTLATNLGDCLIDKGYDVHISKELSTPIGEYIKHTFEERYPRLSPSMKAYLFAADRLMRLEDLTNSNYDIIIWDRYVYSALAYRKMEKLDESWVRSINSIFPEPNLTFFLDVNIEESIDRGIASGKPCPYSKEQLQNCLSIYHRFFDEGKFIGVLSKSKREATNEVFKRVISEFNKSI